MDIGGNVTQDGVDFPSNISTKWCGVHKNWQTHPTSYVSVTLRSYGCHNAWIELAFQI